MERNPGKLKKEMEDFDGNNEAGSLQASSEIIRADENSTGFTSTDENARKGLQTGESMSTEWTDEKHSSYLNSIEASFVQQLHNREYPLMHLHGWLSRTQKLLKQKNSLQSKTGSHLSSGQFKVLRGGCWEKVNFDRARAQLDDGNESHSLLGNPWILHFRSSTTGRRLEEASSDQKNENFESKSVHLGGPKYRTTTCGQTTSSKKPRTRYSGICRQDSVGSNTEISDQNFVDDGCEESELLISPCIKRRDRTAAAVASSKDQVVPSGKPPGTVDANESYTSRQTRDEDYRDGLSENKNGSVPEECVPPCFEDP